MRINKYLAENTNLSRRMADEAIREGKVTVNGKKAELGSEVGEDDRVSLCGDIVQPRGETKTVLLLNKPAGYVCSRSGQGSKTVFELLPEQYQHLQTVGRLDKDSSGLLLLTDDGQLAHELTHPKFEKEKIYEVELDQELSEDNQKQIEKGVELDDGISKLYLSKQEGGWLVKMSEGRNRQIRRTFSAFGYKVTRLHRIKFGSYELSNVQSGKFKIASAG